MLSPDCSWNFDEVNVIGGICNVSVSLKSIYKNKKQKGNKDYLFVKTNFIQNPKLEASHPLFNCSNSIIETLEKSVK